MRSKLIPIDNFVASHVVAFLRMAGVVAATIGLIGGLIWFVDWGVRGDGDNLRWGHFHNPLMQFPPFNETFLDTSLWVLLACSAAMGLGGVMLLIPLKWGVPLVTWQARVSVIMNGVTAVFIVAMMFVFAEHQWDEWHLGGTSAALALRLGSVAVDLTLWTFLSSRPVREFFRWQSHPADYAFAVIVKEAGTTSRLG